MSLLQLLILAMVATIGLAAWRLARVNLGRTPFPEGRVRFLFVLAFVVVPPLALGALIGPAATAGPLRGAASVPLYVVIVAALAILMAIAAQVTRRIVPGRSRRFLLIALIGSDGGSGDVPIDPPLTARLTESVAIVDTANAAFPRGPEFPAQIDRTGFRAAWDTLDAATATLEGRIADESRLGLGVASVARATARDARSRLDTLRSLAVDHGQAWVS